MKSLTLSDEFFNMDDEILTMLLLTNPKSIADLCILLSCDLQLEKEIEMIEDEFGEAE